MRRCIALLLCAALALSGSVRAAETVAAPRARLIAQAAVAGEVIEAPQLAADDPYRLVSSQWTCDGEAVEPGAVFGAGRYELELTVRIRDAGANHADARSYITTDGAYRELASAVDPDAGAITARFAVPVLTPAEAQVRLPRVAPGGNIRDALARVRVSGEASLLTLLVYEDDAFLGLAGRTADGAFAYTGDAAQTFRDGCRYQLVGAATCAGQRIDKVAVQDPLVCVRCTTMGDAGSFGFCAEYACGDAPALPFDDIAPEHWAWDGVRYCYESGLMNGTDAHTFTPARECTRAMIVTILYRLAGCPRSEDTVAFADVAEGQWYTDAVRWAAAQGIVSGYGNGHFGPGDPITREQLAAILFRCSRAFPAGQGDLSTFPDAERVSPWAREAVAWAVATGTMQGKAIGGTAWLQPQGHATRAECATLLQRWCETTLDGGG